MARTGIHTYYKRIARTRSNGLRSSTVIILFAEAEGYNDGQPLEKIEVDFIAQRW